MQPVAATLDPARFTIVPHVAIVDEFVMTNGDGSVKATIDESWLRSNCDHMNEREAATGDLCPIVIGHTPDEPLEEREASGPPLIGYLRNWHVADLFDTGRKASHADAWIMNEEVERARRFPRRSAEIYTDRFEVDPCSFLGATTPARDLGLLKLSRDGSGCGASCRVTYTSPYQNPEIPAVDKSAVDKVADPKQSGDYKGLEAKVDALSAKLDRLIETYKSQSPTAADGAPPAEPDAEPAGPDGADAGNEPSDEELEKLLMEAGGDGSEPPDATDSKKREPKEKEARVSAMENELRDLKVKLARQNVVAQLDKLKGEGYVKADSANAELVADLMAMPEDMRGRQMELLKLHRSGAAMAANGSNPAGWLEVATRHASDGNKKRIESPEQKAEVLKLARDKKCSFPEAARQLGYVYGE